MRIKIKLALGALLTAICLIAVGGTSLYYLNHVADVSQQLVDQHAEPIILADTVEKSAWEIWSHLIVHTSTYDVETMHKINQKLTTFWQQNEQQLTDFANLYVQQQLALPAEIERFNATWADFKQHADTALGFSDDFMKEDALRLLVTQGRALFYQSLAHLHGLEQQHREAMAILRNESNNIRAHALGLVGFITLLVILTNLVAFFILARNITRPLNIALETAQQITLGNLTARSQHHTAGNKNDETGVLLAAMNRMADNLQITIHELSKVFGQFAKGNMAARINSDFLGDFVQLKQAANEMGTELQDVIHETRRVLSHLAQGDMQVSVQREFAGDFAEIKHSLDNTAQKLNEATAENNRQNWIKSGQSQLSEQTSGDKPLLTLAEDMINFLTPYLNAQVGAFYLVQSDEAADKKPYLKTIATHAYVWRTGSKYEFAIGEGIVGQAAMERKTFVLKEPPNDYVLIESGLGHAVPRMILVAPFLYENQVKGVIELATIEPFSPLHLEFLQQVLPAIAIAVNTAESRNRMRELLAQSEAQATALRAQQVEMETQQSELQESNDKLKNQSVQLQTQSEELQAQSEELRQANEELEERTRALERQQGAIEQKNRELEKAKTAMQSKANELELTSKYKSEFLANMSHELRTPLNSLLILAQMLAGNKKGHLDAKEAEQAQTIYNAGADLLTLINDILDLSKVEAGKVQLHVETFPLQRLLEQIQQRFEPIAERKQLAFNIAVAANVPEQLHSDIQRLQQVITNLFSNAFKFTERGTVKLHVYPPQAEELQSFISLNLPATNSIAFAVSDTGIGIPQSKQQVIFEAFQQVDGTTSRRFGGTGLGLSISRQLARLLGGDIHLHSVEQQGSTFTLYVPAHLQVDHVASMAMATTTATHLTTPTLPQVLPSSAAAQHSVTEATTTPPQQVVDDRATLTDDAKVVLIVDDDPKFVDILREVGHEEGYQCLIAHNGQDGLALAEQYRPDAIVLDIGLPLVDGLTVMDNLKQNLATRHIPVHVISANEYGRTVKQMGALGYSLKPVNMEQLNAAFAQFRRIVDQDTRYLLLISDNSQHRTEIQTLLSSKEVEIHSAETAAAALNLLQTGDFDCVVLDMDTQAVVSLLQQLHTILQDRPIPLIFYAERELKQQEVQYLNAWQGEAALKAVYSPERLVDEVTLFLHQLETELSEEKRTMLRMVHDKEAVLKERKVLLVDDDMRNIYAISAVLEEKDMHIFAAENGKQALEVLAQHADIDIVLMDIMMPEMDGYETMRHIRSQHHLHKLPIIALTAKAMKDDRTKCLEAGANDYLPKPVNSDQLISLLRVWLYQ